MKEIDCPRQFWLSTASKDIHVGLRAPGLYEAISPREARELADALNRAADEVDPQELQLPEPTSCPLCDINTKPPVCKVLGCPIDGESKE